MMIESRPLTAQYVKSVQIADARGSHPPIRLARRKVGRNETCPFCTSGKKFKHCCLLRLRLKPAEAEPCTPSQA